MNQQTEVQKTGRICRAELNVMEVLWVQGKNACKPYIPYLTR